MKTSKAADRAVLLGRPRAFDEAEALEKAMHVFWRKGYDAASMAELTAAMGINAPSLYAAFGNKEALFGRALAHYGEGQMNYVQEALAAPTAREVAERRLSGAIEAVCNDAQPAGCLAVQASAKCGDSASLIGKQVAAFFKGMHQSFVTRFERAKQEGDLPADADPVALARCLNAVAYGISIQAASGVPRTELRQVADLTLQLWPGPSPGFGSVRTNAPD